MPTFHAWIRVSPHKKTDTQMNFNAVDVQTALDLAARTLDVEPSVLVMESFR